MVDLVTAIRSVRAEMNIAPATLTPLVLVGRLRRDRRARAALGRRGPADGTAGRHSFADRGPEGAVQLLVRGEVAALPLKGVIDLAAEKARLDKELAKVEADIKRVDAKLGNADFMARAPEEVVDEREGKARRGGGPQGKDRRGAGAVEDCNVSGARHPLRPA